MEINTKNAAGLFFPDPSLESVYFEAVANSLDANATKIWVKLDIADFQDVSTFKLEISDNGEGFTDRNFQKFSKLLEAEEKTHKGVGRLVFMQYFDKVEIESYFNKNSRHFIFDDSFRGESETTKSDKENITTLRFSGYNKLRIKQYSYVIPKQIIESLLQYFFPKFYDYKLEKRELEISIELTTQNPNTDYNFVNQSNSLNVKDIPDLLVEDCGDNHIDLFAKFKMYYSVKQNYEKDTLITAICVDDRTISEEIITKNCLPINYEMIFLLHSDYFQGKANINREALEIDDDTKSKIKLLFRNKVIELITRLLPEVGEKNEKLKQELNSKYPHLDGYFEKNSIGLIDKDKTLDIAQTRFLNDQKETLEATALDDKQYEKSLEVSSRLLTEYVLYRTKIIKKLKTIDPNNDEVDIHNLLVPKDRIYRDSDFFDSMFSNNAWLIDDKFMSYNTILSNKKLKDMYKEAGISGSKKKADDRPDITVIFSNDPDKVSKIDVVIVELKKLGLTLARKEELISQLRQRARVLLNHYPDKIQRIWFYGIVDIDTEFRISMKETGFVELFSPGSMFYNELKIIIDEETEKSIPWGIFIQSYQSFLSDAETRNSTFLNILKQGIKNSIEPKNFD